MLSYLLATMAGPKVRIGFMEAPDMGLQDSTHQFEPRITQQNLCKIFSHRISDYNSNLQLDCDCHDVESRRCWIAIAANEVLFPEEGSNFELLRIRLNEETTISVGPMMEK